MNDDITFCLSECDKTECYRHPSNIQDKTIPHSYADFSGDKCWMKESCSNCSYRYSLQRFDYGNVRSSTEIASVEDGFACGAFVDEGVIVHMVNIGEDGLCEMYSRRFENNEV